MIYAIDINQNTFAPAKYTNIATFINLIIPLLQLGAAIIFLIMLLYGAFIWITAGGNQENITKANKTFSYAVLGLVLVVISFFLVKLIGYVLRINILF